jgi:pimeloyl-ACP methyl ester carboxylesterase
MDIPALWHPRAPGRTCMNAIDGGDPGRIDHPINSSKGCGGVMRAAPAGLISQKKPMNAAILGAETAALTHSHDLGWLPGAMLGHMVAELVSVEKLPMEQAARNALFALTAADTPDYLQGMVSEGMFTTFYESLYYHIKEMKQPIQPALEEIRGYLRLFTGYDIKHDGPLFRIHKLKKPLLMLQSKQDKYSLPERAKVLYDKCRAPKRLVYFEKGAHSHIKINASEKYDKIIVDFLRELCENISITDGIVGE